MTIYALPARMTFLATLALLVLGMTALPARAENAPGLTDAIQAALPDSISLDDKVVYLDFWASWCVPCRQSFPKMQDLYDRYHSRGLEIVAVSVDKDHAAALKFLRDTKATFPVIFDSTGSLAEKYGLEAMPSSFIYGRDGQLVSRKRGFRPEDTDSLDYAIFKLLGKGKTE
jgi:thiol-disulfide isomerase/thioredoxin